MNLTVTSWNKSHAMNEKFASIQLRCLIKNECEKFIQGEKKERGERGKKPGFNTHWEKFIHQFVPHFHQWTMWKKYGGTEQGRMMRSREYWDIRPFAFGLFFTVAISLLPTQLAAFIQTWIFIQRNFLSLIFILALPRFSLSLSLSRISFSFFLKGLFLLSNFHHFYSTHHPSTWL